MAGSIAATPRPAGLPAEIEWDEATGTWLDPATRTRKPWTPTDAAAFAAQTPGTMPASDYTAASKRLGKEAAANIGIAAGAGTLQALASFIPTAQDLRNRQELGRLADLERKGKLGLSGKERGQMEREMLTPVRALAHESRVREEELAAASGGQSVGALVRARREEGREVADQARKAGTTISRANLEKAQAQMDEIDRRTGYKDNQQQQRITAVKGAVVDAAKVAGKVAAGQAITETSTPEDLQKMFPELANVPVETLATWLRAERMSPGYINFRRRELGGTDYMGSIASSTVAPAP